MRLLNKVGPALILIAFSHSSLARTLEEVVSFANEAMNEINVTPSFSGCEESRAQYRPAPLHEAFNKRGADCSAFIGANGYGPLGQVLLQKFDELGECSPLLLVDNDLGEVCPRWKLLDLKERKNFWVHSFAAIAWAESTCKENAKAPGVHGTALGLLQLNATRSNRSWRGADCDVPNIFSAKSNLRCGVDIMNELMKEDVGIYKARGLYGRKSNSYWQELRREDGGLIGERIKTFTPCFRP